MWDTFMKMIVNTDKDARYIITQYPLVAADSTFYHLKSSAPLTTALSHSSPVDFAEYTVKVRQMLSILKARQSIISNKGIYLSLCLLRDRRVFHHHEDEREDCSDGL